MDVLSLTLVLAIIFGWCVLASRLQRVGLTAPIVFVAAGFVLAEGLEILDLALEPHLVKVIAEVTLVWVLFADASRVRPQPVPTRPRPVRSSARGRAAADGRAGDGRRAGGARRLTCGRLC